MKRAVTTIVLAAGALWGIFSLSLTGFKIFLLIAGGLGLWEYARLAFPDRFLERRWVEVSGMILLGSLLWFSESHLRGAPLFLFLLVLFLFLSFLLVMGKSDPVDRSMERLGLMTLGWLYLSLTLPFWGWLAERGDGNLLVLLAVVSACLTDTFAFLFGKTIGRHKCLPILSPNKTWEGYAGALFGGVLGAFLVQHFWLPTLPLRMILLFGLIMGVVAPLGDLAESLLKRSRGVKDSSHLIPGHGGVLDRLDALIFAGPFAYFYLVVVMRL